MRTHPRITFYPTDLLLNARQKVSSNVTPNDSQEIKPYKTFWLWQSATTGVNQTQLYTHFLRRSQTD